MMDIFCTFSNVMLDSLLQNNKALKGILGVAIMITFQFLQAADVFVLVKIL